MSVNDKARELKREGHAVRVSKTYDADGLLMSERVIQGNKDFKLVSNKHFNTFQKIIAENAGAARAFFYLAYHMDNANAVVISRECLANALNTSVASIARWIKFLVTNEYIMIAKSSNTNVYHINADIIWHGNGVQFAKLKANIVLSSAEQRAPVAVTTEFTKRVSEL